MADSRKVHVKLVSVNGATHFISVLPPGPVIADEIVWRERKRPSEAAFAYDGPANMLLDYALSRT